MRKVLFVCTANLQRSPTAEQIFQGWKGIWEAKSAGIMPEPGCTPLSQEIIDWADVIIVMETLHSQYIRTHFQRAANKISVLGIPDRYFRNEPKLQQELHNKVPSILERAGTT
jgi:predicted protein tyrosine phosphatase